MFNDRQQLLTQLSRNADAEWDIIIVGGGITGAGVLREAVRKGWKALLIEQQDFSWGTSSRSSKMVHGGLRYLALGDLTLTKHSLSERERLIKEAPGLVERMGYYLMLERGKFPGRFAMGIALTVYDWIAALKEKVYRHRFIAPDDVVKQFPGIRTTKLSGASYYSDAVTDDARLVLRVLHESVQAGGQILNYVKAKKISDNDNHQAIELEDTESGEHVHLKAKVIVNATGGWVDQLRNQVNPERRIRPLRGSHVIIPHDKLPLNDAVSLYHPQDKRPVFMFPWEGVTVIGTTDLDHTDDMNKEASITTQELEYLLAIIKHQFPHSDISADDIIATFSGVRPVIASDDGKDPGKERRDHALWCDGRLITVSGGKLTTFRLIALDVMRAAQQWLQPEESSENGNDRTFRPTQMTASDIMPEDKSWSQRLLGRYGDDAKALLQQAPFSEQEKIAHTHYCLAECRWSLKNEAVIHLDDLLLRRTRLGLLLKNGAEELFEALKVICCDELGWNNEHWERELKRYRQLINHSYSLPVNA